MRKLLKAMLPVPIARMIGCVFVCRRKPHLAGLTRRRDYDEICCQAGVATARRGQVAVFELGPENLAEPNPVHAIYELEFTVT